MQQKKMGKRLEQTLSLQEDIWMASKHRKMCSIFSVIRERTIKITTGHLCISTRKARRKRLRVPSIDKDVVQKEWLHTD
jgi:hypothetical protein